jgi:hypothetical protein
MQNYEKMKMAKKCKQSLKVLKNFGGNFELICGNLKSYQKALNLEKCEAVKKFGLKIAEGTEQREQKFFFAFF